MVLMWIICFVIIVVALILLGFDHWGRRIKVITIVIILFLIILSLITVLKSSDIKLDSPKGVISGFSVYSKWMGNTISNLWDVGVDVTHKVKDAVSHKIE